MNRPTNTRTIESGNSGWTSRLSDLLPQLVRYANRLGCDHFTADDLVQDTLVTALEKSHCFDAARPLKPWLMGIMIRHFKYTRRQAARRVSVDYPAPQLVPSAVEEVFKAEDARVVLRELGRLASPYREVVELFFAEDLGLVDISDRLARKRSTVSTQLNRGLHQLRMQWPAGIGQRGSSTKRPYTKAM